MGDTFGSSFAVRRVREGVASYMREVGYLSAGFVLVTIIDRGTGFPRSMICVVWLPSLIGGTVVNEMMKPDELLELIDGFVRISRERPLVEALGRRQRRLIADHDVDEPQPFDVPSENAEAHRERRRQQQSDRPP